MRSSIHDSKTIEVRDIHGKKSLIWAKDEDNPDYKLVIINAANQGFQSKMNKTIGSYAIKQLTQRLAENIGNNNNKKFLNEILEDIQEELHNNGKQLIVKTFNNKTEYIKFRQHKNEKRKKQDIEMQRKPHNDYVLLS